jgi:hypothetical protein
MARRLVSLRSMRAYIRRARSAITRVTLDNVNPIFAREMVRLLSQCPSLSHFDVRVQLDVGFCFEPIRSLVSLTTLVISDNCPMTHHELGVIFRNCPCLERVEAYGLVNSGREASWPVPLPNLRRLAISSHVVGLVISFRPLSIPHLHDVYPLLVISQRRY